LDRTNQLYDIVLSFFYHPLSQALIKVPITDPGAKK